MSEYTPTTQQVEDGFAHEPEYEYSNPIGYGAYVQGNRRAFRRWLAEVERKAAEKAWHEGVMTALDSEGKPIVDRTRAMLRNPYRQEGKE